MAEIFTRRFETAEFGTHWQIQYAGETTGDYGDDDPHWRIWKLTWADNDDGTSSVTSIQVRTGVAWSDRDDLWTS